MGVICNASPAQTFIESARDDVGGKHFFSGEIEGHFAAGKDAMDRFLIGSPFY
jgi:hypothetical protein